MKLSLGTGDLSHASPRGPPRPCRHAPAQPRQARHRARPPTSRRTVDQGEAGRPEHAWGTQRGDLQLGPLLRAALRPQLRCATRADRFRASKMQAPRTPLFTPYLRKEAFSACQWRRLHRGSRGFPMLQCILHRSSLLGLQIPNRTENRPEPSK